MLNPEAAFFCARRVLVLIGVICSLVLCGPGQQQSAPVPNTSSTGPQAQAEPQSSNPLQTSVDFFNLLQKKSLVFPDLATNTNKFDTWDKFKLAANNSVALSTFAAAGLSAGYGQAINSPAGYGQGGEGYGKRFGAAMARGASYNMFGNFLIASLTHEDPRFFVKKNLSFKESVRYAAIRVFVTRSDSGDKVVNYAGLVGPLAAEALATTYYPEGNRGVGDVFIRYGSDIGWIFAGNMVKQYWPRINRKLHLAPETTTPAPAVQ